ncbi:alpha/beta hydrolase family protein [Aliiruegeria haliotis]|uniref:Alpha/beta hydrolase family protein n=1 Tax=Aliiruegeria haliotis TaxID=1280846 RepID=A0A2T0RWD5_9RHOB|nr:alpha/beta hydrolase [Aliiruegeria haliotis]PRY25505.1 alpha/beta hydrolase family protein [Aliiruegeria haliotis]
MTDPTAYDNADFIPDGHSYFPRWAAAAEAFRAALPASRQRLDRVYGPHPSQAFDLFLPEGTPEGLMVFIHGGFWRLSGRKDWSHLAKGFLGNGWAVAIPSYPLAPEVRIAEITRSIAHAMPVMAAEVAGPIIISGHSAGGHLTCRMLCPDVDLPRDVSARISGILPISPLADLNPLIMLPMNADLRIDAAEADTESPILHPEPTCPVQIVVGSAERQSFIDQAIRLADVWNRSDLSISDGCHHFDVIDPLEDPRSEMVLKAISMASTD